MSRCATSRISLRLTVCSLTMRAIGASLYTDRRSVCIYKEVYLTIGLLSIPPWGYLDDFLCLIMRDVCLRQGSNELDSSKSTERSSAVMLSPAKHDTGKVLRGASIPIGCDTIVSVRGF